ncbi:MAG: alpha/beta hydrolase family protein [Candidatus Latescibacterota bacterium]|nr:alpha/beta hydrolase family protein [Candidatus Latescibacterota bacterium]
MESNARSMKYGPGTASQASQWQDHVRSQLIDMLCIGDQISGVAESSFQVETVSSIENHGYISKELKINATPSRQIEVIVTVPVRWSRPSPAVVAIAGHGGDRHTCYTKDSYHKCAHVLAEQGYVTISTGISRHDIYESGRTLMGERLWDLICCVDFLESMEEVDNERISCIGNSLGGEMVMWLAAIDPRISAAVSSSFLTRMDQMENNHCMCWKFPGLRDIVDFPDIYSLIAPRPLLCQNGLKEPPTQFPVDLAREAMDEIQVIYHDLNTSENLQFIAHEGGHEVHLPSLCSFLDRHLTQVDNDCG